jgi:hypothetical protein
MRLSPDKVAQEFRWRNGANAEPVDAGEVGQIVRDDRIGAAGDSQFSDHVVVGIPEQRPPEEEDLLLPGDEAKVVHDGRDAATDGVRQTAAS